MGAWIFQGNPKHFPGMDTYLVRAWNRPSREILWTVGSKWRRRIQPGDCAFLWRADGNVRFSGGLIGVGHVLSEPLFIPDDAPGDWAPDKRAAAEALDWRVRIALEELHLTPGDGMLRRIDLKHDETLSTLLILRYWRVMVSPVTPMEEQELLQRWDAARLNIAISEGEP